MKEQNRWDSGKLWEGEIERLMTACCRVGRKLCVMCVCHCMCQPIAHTHLFVSFRSRKIQLYSSSVPTKQHFRRVCGCGVCVSVQRTEFSQLDAFPTGGFVYSHSARCLTH